MAVSILFPCLIRTPSVCHISALTWRPSQGDSLRMCGVELIKGQPLPPFNSTLGRGSPLPHTPSCPWVGWLELDHAL